MRFSDLLAASLSSLRQRFFRTSLTVLGVVIGTMAVVVMLSLGLGMSQTMMDQYGSMNLNRVNVYSVPDARPPGAPALKMDASAIKALEQMPGVVEVQPIYRADVVLKVGRHDLYNQITGMSLTSLQALDVDYATGGPPQAGDPLSFVYGARVNEMFWDEVRQEPIEVDWETTVVFMTLPDPGVDPNIDPAKQEPGQTPAAPSKRITVPMAGILYEPEGTWSSESDTIFADLDTLIKSLQRANPGATLSGQENAKASLERGDFLFSEFYVVTATPEDAETLNNLLREEGYSSHAEVEYIRQMQQQALTIQAVLGGIGFISLLVAAIGIANTMLMSVYERTKEIGIMKVLGASLGDIRRMFLIESASIGFFGGLVGLGLSLLVSMGINAFIAPSMGVAGSDGTPTSISIIPLPLALAALLGATLIGMVSGFVPAQRATRLSPLEAIRSQ